MVGIEKDSHCVGGFGIVIWDANQKRHLLFGGTYQQCLETIPAIRAAFQLGKVEALMELVK